MWSERPSMKSMLKQFADTRKMMKMVSQGGNMKQALMQPKGRHR